MSRYTTRLRRFPILIAALLCFAPRLAYGQDAAPLSPQEIAAQAKALHPKTLVLVFDVSASTRTGGVFGNERAASATILRDGCDPGDRVVLETFGTGYKTVFDKTLTDNAEKDALIDQLPSGVAPGQGTNIRWPHHEALKTVAGDLPHPGVIVLLTDSFNDRPLTTDPSYPKYLAYYTLKGLTIYPHTPENRGYERLMRTLKASGKLHEFGVGVGIAPSERPIERLPVGPGQGDQDTTATMDTPTVLTPTVQGKPASNLPMILGGLAALIVAGVVGGYLLLSRPSPIRLKLGDRGTPRDYRLRAGAKIGLGGALTSAGPGDDVFPLAGLSTAVAFVQGERGGARLLPAPTLDPSISLFHSGLKLEAPVSLRVGDEVRVVLPATDTAPAREHRIHVEDPRGAAL